MAEAQRRSVWESGEAYEPYVGRWSRLVAREFLHWLALAPSARWLDVGCGTGALSQTILTHAAPTVVHGIDPSEGYLTVARCQVCDARARFEPGDAQQLPVETSTYDAVVSGLVLNFIPSISAGLTEMVRVAKPEGTVAAYVWDYAEGMQLMRRFWDAAAALDPRAVALDEGARFPLCRREALTALFDTAGLQRVQTASLEIETRFADFDDYWLPFLGGQGPAPAYAMSLDDAARTRLRERLRATLPVQAGGAIALTARAWAVQGVRA